MRDVIAYTAKVSPTTNNENSSAANRQSTVLRENVTTTLLKPSDNRKIFDFLGPRCFTLATGIVQLLEADMSEGVWEVIGTGVICYVRDYNKREVSLQLVDPSYARYSMGLWKLIVSSNVNFIKMHSNLVAFEADDETLYALNFTLNSEAEKFFFTVHDQQIERKRRMALKKGRKSSVPQEAATPIPSVTEDDKFIAREKNMELSKQASNESNMAVKALLTDLSAKVDSALTSIKQSTSMRITSDIIKKKKKKKSAANRLNKLDIGLPTDFVHKAHCGDNPFMDDSEMDKTVREIYAFLQIDINEADKQEIDMIRQQVTMYGAEKLRLSMRRPNNKQLRSPTTLNINKDGMDSSNLAPVVGLKEARDSLRLRPRDQRPITPTSIKHFNEGKRNEIEQRLSNTTTQRQDHLERLAKHQDDWLISSKEMCIPKARRSIRNVPHPPPPPACALSKVNANLLPLSTTKGENRAESASAPGKQHPRLEDRKHTVNASNACSHKKMPRDASGGSIGSQAAIPPQSPPPPPPPIPPIPPPPASLPSTISSMGKSNSVTSCPPAVSDERQNLLEAIRNADKSALRKVSGREVVENGDSTLPSSPDSGNNLMDAIGKMIEERRKHINDSSDEDEDESDDEEEEWTD